MAIINFAEALQELSRECSEITESKGFNDVEWSDIILAHIQVKLGLITSEVSEALGVLREEYDDSEEDEVIRMTPMQEEDFTDELADIIIRTLDLAGNLELEIGQAVVNKVHKNVARPKLHGKRF